MPVIVMLILAGLALVTMFAREQASLPAAISYDEFVRQVQAGNVSAVASLPITVDTVVPDAPTISVSPSRIEPSIWADGGSRPSAARAMVVLPQPEGPMMETYSPG